eukprot:1228969-Amphidinium_carterae.1
MLLVHAVYVNHTVTTGALAAELFHLTNVPQRRANGSMVSGEKPTTSATTKPSQAPLLKDVEGDFESGKSYERPRE